MCMVRHQLLALAYATLMILIFAGTYVLGEDSWMAYLLLVPGFLILKSMNTPQAESGPLAARTKILSESLMGGSGTRTQGVRRLARIGLAFLLLSVPAAMLIDALRLNDLTMWLVLMPVLFLVSLVDREYFGWTDPSERAPLDGSHRYSSSE